MKKDLAYEIAKGLNTQAPRADTGPTLLELQHAGIIGSDPARPRTKPAGSSPALRITCPVCQALPGEYCTKWSVARPGAPASKVQQTIAHKLRRTYEENTR